MRIYVMTILGHIYIYILVFYAIIYSMILYDLHGLTV